MAKECKICGKPSLFYIWSTSRRFDREKFLDLYRKNIEVTQEDEHLIRNQSYVVCQFCMDKYNL